ncbi:MAG: DoxX family protein [Rhodospirillales bacterium]|nr:DoxX family protein [Rhodospirillales bacterium]
MSAANQVQTAALLLRVALGVMFVAHAGLKIFVFTIPGTVQFFESIGYPGFFAYLTILAELFGGIALILGVQVRLVAAGLIPILIGATIQHAGNGWMFASPNGGWEFPAFWTVALAVQALLGAGSYALRLPFLPEIGAPKSAEA